MKIAGILIEVTETRWIIIPKNASVTSKVVSFLEEILLNLPDTNFRLTFAIEGIGEVPDNLKFIPEYYKKN